MTQVTEMLKTLGIEIDDIKPVGFIVNGSCEIDSVSYFSLL